MSAASRSAPVVSLELERVTYGDGTVALRDVALAVAPGEIVGVAGHVGAGKTTLALAAAGLLGRSVPAGVAGRLARASQPRGAPPAAYVFANPRTQLTELGGTVEEEVAVGPENLAVPAGLIRPRVERALALADASHLAGRAPAELSGGELQRVALAAALALEAPLLVLDEPTAQLDPQAARAFADRLRALAAAGLAVLLVEQNLALLTELADRLLVLADGTVLAEGDPRALLERHPPLDPRLGAAETAVERGRVRPPDAGASPLLEIRGLGAGYDGHQVLDELSLTVPRGSSVAWIGRNGAGKSTLARAVVGLVPARAGSVRVDGVVLDPLPVERRARYVGLVFQDPQRQLFSRTVLDEASFAPRTMGLTAGEARARARDALEVVGLAACERGHPGDLAPQSQRLLAIAAAMAAAPPLLLLDEPTAGQDAAGRAAIARAVARQRERGAAVVITHDLRFAQRVCDEAMVVEGGRVARREW